MVTVSIFWIERLLQFHRQLVKVNNNIRQQFWRRITAFPVAALAAPEPTTIDLQTLAWARILRLLTSLCELSRHLREHAVRFDGLPNNNLPKLTDR